MDYAAWVQRASKFLRSLTWLPGEFDINDGIEEPAGDQHSLDWLNSPKCSAPAEVGAFMRNASKRCCLRYRWKPPEPYKAQISAIWTGHDELAGGGDLCELARHQVYDDREWFQSVFGGPGAGQSASPDEILREHGLIPILIHQNKGYLSLNMKAEREHPPVVYTPAENPGKQHQISASFDQFLMDWERLCYITPDPETLAPWLSADGHGLDTEREATDRLHALFAAAGTTIQDSMNGTSDSVSAWFRRAENFVRQLNRLPGQWGISVSVEPPVRISNDDESAATLPAPLVRLYTEGSARFSCRYHCRPASNDLPRIRELISHEYSFYGGVEFIPWEELPRTPGVDWGWFDEDHHTKKERLADAIWKRTLPFIFVANGDFVGLLTTDSPGFMPVVYLSHEEPAEVTVLSESIERFLADWERLGYIGPEIWLLSEFLDRAHGGAPRIDLEKADRWREMLLGGDASRSDSQVI